MKIAYFAPLPPKRTGVATYAAQLARALSGRAELTFFDSKPSVPPIGDRALVDYVARPEALAEVEDCDAALYQFGNNPEFHAPIYRAFLAKPGMVVLHDTVLYFLMAGLADGGMLREFLFHYGPDRLAEFFKIPADSPEHQVLRYPWPERYPFLKRIVTLAPGIIVHSRTSADIVTELGVRAPIHVIPHLAYPEMLNPPDPETRTSIRRSLGVDQDELLIGCFGFIGPTKRLSSVFKALALLNGEIRFKLLIVGEGPDPSSDIAANGLSDRVVQEGFVDQTRFDTLLRSIDVLANLRFPSMGETSGPQTQAMAAGLPTIVTNHAWFGELPDDAVIKIGSGSDEIETLAGALRNLATKPALRAEIGNAARAYIAAHCAPDAVAVRYIEALKTIRAPAGFYPSAAAQKGNSLKRVVS